MSMCNTDRQAQDRCFGRPRPGQLCKGSLSIVLPRPRTPLEMQQVHQHGQLPDRLHGRLVFCTDFPDNPHIADWRASVIESPTCMLDKQRRPMRTLASLSQGSGAVRQDQTSSTRASACGRSSTKSEYQCSTCCRSHEKVPVLHSWRCRVKDRRIPSSRRGDSAYHTLQGSRSDRRRADKLPWSTSCFHSRRCRRHQLQASCRRRHLQFSIRGG